MDNPKLRSFLKFLFPASIFFVCGVLGFATKNDPSPVLKTVELMAILGAFGYLIYRIAPKPETRKALFRVQDLAFFATVYVGALLATFVVTDKWQPVRVLESLSMIYVGMVILLLLNKIKLAWLMMVLKFTGMFIAMAGFSYLLTPNISWITVIIWSIMLPLMNLANSKKKSEPENPGNPGISMGDARHCEVLKALALFRVSYRHEFNKTSCPRNCALGLIRCFCSIGSRMAEEARFLHRRLQA